MDTLTKVGVIFRRVHNVAARPWKEMEIIYRKSRTAEHASYSVIISHVHVQARTEQPIDYCMENCLACAEH